jgi:hypothetical protein
MGTDQVAKIGEVGRFTLAAKKRPAELLFEKLDGARQGGLGHIAEFARAGEIQLVGQREEISNLVHFHDNLAGWEKWENTIIEQPTPKVTTCRYGIVQLDSPI